MEILVRVQVALAEIREPVLFLIGIFVLILIGDEELTDHVLDVVELNLHVGKGLHLRRECLINHFREGEDA